MKNKEDILLAIERLMHYESQDSVFDYDCDIAVIVLKWMIEDSNSSGDLLKDLGFED